MDLTIKVDNQRLRFPTNIGYAVEGSQKFVRFHFEFSENWYGLKAFAQFGQNGRAYNVYLDSKNDVYLPTEIVAGKCTLLLYGSKDSVIATTNYLTLKIDENLLIQNADSTIISESLYNQLVNQVQGFSDRIDNIMTDPLFIAQVNQATSLKVEELVQSGAFAGMVIGDNSIAEIKLNNELRAKINRFEDFLTPEDFGAIGDGRHDDTIAIQSAINSGKSILFPNKKYLINEIEIISKFFWDLDASCATFIYNGNNSAITIKGCSNCNIKLGIIRANNGNAISIISTKKGEESQYINLYFNYISAKNNGIEIKASGGWCNELRFFNGRIDVAEKAVYIEHNYANNIINSLNFYNIGFEGVNSGVCFNAVDGLIRDCIFIGCRSGEIQKDLIITMGRVKNCYYLTRFSIKQQLLNFSDFTENFVFDAPIYNKNEILIGNSLICNSEYKKVINPIRGEINVLNLVTNIGVVDLNILLQGREIEDIDTFIIGQNVTELKLNKKYGTSYGVNTFYIRFSRDIGEGFRVVDSDGNIIFDDMSNFAWKWAKFDFIYKTNKQYWIKQIAMT